MCDVYGNWAVGSQRTKSKEEKKTREKKNTNKMNMVDRDIHEGKTESPNTWFWNCWMELVEKLPGYGVSYRKALNHKLSFFTMCRTVPGNFLISWCWRWTPELTALQPNHIPKDIYFFWLSFANLFLGIHLFCLNY